MIITQTPLRVSLLGGGTDFPEFFEADGGCVLSTTIDKYVFVVAKSRFDEMIRVGYTRSEFVRDVAAVEHDLVRETLRTTGVTDGIEVATMADIPSAGSGLGSSSTVTVGLLHALWSYEGVLVTRERLAREAFAIERQKLMRPVGLQDQYAAAYGGLNFIVFDASGVTVEPAADDPAIGRRLSERLMLFYSGVTRRSSEVLDEQRRRIEEKRPTLRAMAKLARQGREALAAGNLDAVGELMHESWLLKRSLASKVSNPGLDALYDAARRAGAIGGKITGAGGGGFLLVYCRPESQADVRAAMNSHRELEFSLESEGTIVLLHGRRR